mgnify:FL=1
MTTENQCTHGDTVTNVGPQSQACVQCDAQGWEYPDIRFCTVCGFTGCCDGAKGAHMIEHSKSTGHPVIKAVNPNEDWLWCYPDEAYVKL